MARNEAIPSLRIQKHGKRRGRITSIVTTPRKAGKTRQRNRIHRGNAEPTTASHLVPKWMFDKAAADRLERENQHIGKGIGRIRVA